MELFIHHEASPYVRKVLLVCEELGIQPTECKVDWTSPEAMAGYCRINPNGKFPALRDGDLVVWESNAIIVYLAECCGAGHLAGDRAKARARINQWLFWELAHFAAVVNPLASTRMGYESRLTVSGESLLEEFRRLCAVLESQLADGREFIIGEEASLPDFAIAADLTYADEAALPLADFEWLSAWFDRMRARDSWRVTEALKNRALAS